MQQVLERLAAMDARNNVLERDVTQQAGLATQMATALADLPEAMATAMQRQPDGRKMLVDTRGLGSLQASITRKKSS